VSSIAIASVRGNEFAATKTKKPREKHEANRARPLSRRVPASSAGRVS
jgi:hypothetical protein